MKAYVILTLNLCTMHGANMYIYNKTRYLKGHGWKVLVFSAEQGEIVIPGLKEYKPYQEAFLRFYPGCFTGNRVKRFIDLMADKIGAENGDDILVESTNIYSALWGELLAKKLHGRHLSMILQERFGYSEAERDFLRFKVGRHELAGINRLAVGKMLEDESIPCDDSMQIVAHCNNTIDKCVDEISPMLDPNVALTIGSIGRLEKKYVLPLAEQLGQYCRDHAETRFNVVFIGGTREAKQPQRIRDAFKGCSNVNLILTGVMFPIPRSFVDRCDLFISAAGSAWATYYLERPTIFMNPNTGDIIGIPGLTCEPGDFTIYSSNYPASAIGDLIELLAEKRETIRYTGVMKDGSYQKLMNDEFDRQLRFVDLCDSYRYYDTSGIRFSERSYLPFNVLGKIMSPRLLYKGLSFARRLIK